MAMNFNDLIGPKSKPSSIQAWVRYRPTPVYVILEEAQALIYSNLRVREMRTSVVIQLGSGAYMASLPSDYLEAISMQDRDGFNLHPDGFVSEDYLLRHRVYDTDAVTTLTGPVTTTDTVIHVASALHFPATGNYSVTVDSEVMLVTGGQGTLNWTVTRGYSATTAAAHSSGASVDNSLATGTPRLVAIFGENFQFEVKTDGPRAIDMVYFQRPALLSATNTTNFLTRRYPNVVRSACLAAAASYMKDTDEYQRTETELLALIQSVNAESDLGKAA